MQSSGCNNVAPETSLVHYEDSIEAVVVAPHFLKEGNRVIDDLLGGHPRFSTHRFLRRDAGSLCYLCNRRLGQSNVEVSVGEINQVSLTDSEKRTASITGISHKKFFLLF